jgi:hypothetical protein
MAINISLSIYIYKILSLSKKFKMTAVIVTYLVLYVGVCYKEECLIVLCSVVQSLIGLLVIL